MPPLGGALSDEQIASVLTYVRREWGNTGAPVSVEDVQEIRGLTKTRTRPWTDAELTPAGRGRRRARAVDTCYVLQVLRCHVLNVLRASCHVHVPRARGVARSVGVARGRSHVAGRTSARRT